MLHRKHPRGIIPLLVILCSVSCQNTAMEYLAPEFSQVLVEVDGPKARFQGSLTHARVEECGIILIADEEKTLVQAKLDGTRFEASVAGLRVDKTYTWRAYAKAGENEIRSEEYTLTLTDGAIPIPDPAFKEYLLKECDSDRDGEISLSEASSIWRISFCTDTLHVKSLSGIEFMPALEEIDCPGTFPDEMDPAGQEQARPLGTLASLDVSHNPKLRVLRVPNNADLGESQHNLDISGNPKLERLDLGRTGLQIPDISHLPGLVELRLAYLHGSLPDLKPLTLLKILDISYEQSGRRIDVDVSHSPYLEELRVSGIALSITDLSFNRALRVLSVADNDWADIDVSVLPKLQELDCYGNRFQTLDVSANPALHLLRMAPGAVDGLPETLYVSPEQRIPGVTENRSEQFIPAYTTIVIKTVVPVTGVTLSPESLFLAEGKMATLQVTVLPENADNKTVRWTSSDDATASVDDKGTVSAHRTGTSVITVTTVDGGMQATCTVTVLAASEIGDYQEGDVVDSDGLGAIVHIFEDGRMLLMSVDELQYKDWGESNDWCHAYGNAWRMPAIEELTLIHDNFDNVNAALEASDHLSLSIDDNCYWSGTANPKNAEYYYRERLRDGTIFSNTENEEHSSSTSNFARAVKIVSAGDISVLVLRISFALREIIDADGVGIVAHVFPNGETLLMSVHELAFKTWEESNDWCLSYGDAWRMPTIDELTLIHRNFTLINRSLASHDYPTLTTDNYCHWSSTVNPQNADYYYREKLYSGEIFRNTGSDERKTSHMNYTRAVKIIQTAP